jgi:hypothetical protein
MENTHGGEKEMKIYTVTKIRDEKPRYFTGEDADGHRWTSSLDGAKLYNTQEAAEADAEYFDAATQEVK